MAQRDLEIRPGLTIPGSEVEETASRSSGPGGQNVNKTSTRVTLRWNVGTSVCITDAQRRRIRDRLSSRITLGGELLVHAQAHRTRPRNRELARARLAELVREALLVQRRRVATKPSASSRRRVRDAKKRRRREPESLNANPPLEPFLVSVEIFDGFFGPFPAVTPVAVVEVDEP